MEPQLNYNCDDAATLLKFHNSTARVRGIGGPPGSGKSVACAMEHIHFLAQRQQADRNNLRRTRVAIIRATYPMLKTTTHKTVTEWVIQGTGNIPNTPPMRGITRYTHPSGDGTIVECEILFMALETEDDLKKLDSLEVSSIYGNEVNEQPEAIFTKYIERVGRFPPPKDGVKCTEPCVSVDFNLPGKEHWIHKYFIAKDFEENEHFKHSDIECFIQPAAVICDNYKEVQADEKVKPKYHFNPLAENLTNLPEGYYGGQLAMNNWNKIQSRLMMMWVTPNTGKRIHDEYKTSVHKSNDDLEIFPHETVYVGFDTSGQNKGLVFTQYVKASLRVLREAYVNGGTETAIEELLIPILNSTFPHCPVVVVCDPANPKDDRTGVTPTALLRNQYNLNAVIAPGGNRLALRINAMAKLLKRVGGMIIDRCCEMVNGGLDGGYVFEKDKAATKQFGIEIFKNKKLDNEYAHYIDALQNVALHLNSGAIHQHQGQGGQQQIPKIKRRRTM